MRIYLIRHGETSLNVARVLQPADTPLSERGIEQAERLATRLSDAGLVRIFASDLARARMTAERILRRVSVPLEFESLLHERNFGDLRGTPYTELASDPFAPGFAPPGGETWEVFHQRVEQAWRRMQGWVRAAEGPIAVVTHGLVCHALVTRHTEPPAGKASVQGGGIPPPRFGNTSLTILAGPSPWRVELLACSVHLGDSAPGVVAAGRA